MKVVYRTTYKNILNYHDRWITPFFISTVAHFSYKMNIFSVFFFQLFLRFDNNKKMIIISISFSGLHYLLDDVKFKDLSITFQDYSRLKFKVIKLLCCRPTLQDCQGNSAELLILQLRQKLCPGTPWRKIQSLQTPENNHKILCKKKKPVNEKALQQHGIVKN